MFTTEQMVASIVRDILGEDIRITPQEVAKTAYDLGRMKGDHRAMVLFCDYFLKACKNFNSEFDANGERMVLKRLATFAPRVIFDVGANVGEWSQLALAEIPGAHIDAFEIVDRTFGALEQKLAGERRATLNNFGLFTHDGEINMHVFEASSAFASHMPFPHGKNEKIACPVRAGDSYMREKRIEKIDFLKLDVEGAEPDILKGFAGAFGKGQIDVVQFEYGQVSIMTHFLLCDFYKFFDERGYAVGKIYPDFVDFRAYAMDDEDFLGPNYIACRRERADILQSLGRRG